MILKEIQKSFIVASAATFLLFFSSLSTNAADLAALQQLGEQVFWDKISNPPRMACVTCHDPRAGWTGSQSQTNLTQVAITGANPHTIGNRKPPSNAYASFIPPFQEGVIRGRHGSRSPSRQLVTNNLAERRIIGK
jgi:cytochrome c peroxidase